MFRRLLDAVIPVLVAVVLLVIAWPGLFGLERTAGVAQVASFRAAAAAIAAVGVLFLLLVTAASRRGRRLAASVALVLALFVGLQAIIITDRGLGGTSADKQTGDITVLSWNTLGDSPDATVVADLALQEHADLITMPETTKDFGVAVSDVLTASGETWQVFSVAFDRISKARSTTVLVSSRLGTYTEDDSRGSTGQLPSVVLRPDANNAPTLVAVHAVAPVPDEFSTWRTDLDWLASVCTGDTIMAGDFNSTLDHWSHLDHDAGAQLGGCADAGLARNAAAVGTWPTWAPPLLGTPIDHVLATSQWHATAMRVVETLDTAGSDHRPIVATLSRVDP